MVGVDVSAGNTVAVELAFGEQAAKRMTSSKNNEVVRFILIITLYQSLPPGYHLSGK